MMSIVVIRTILTLCMGRQVISVAQESISLSIEISIKI
jgi:hypothetical protein